MESMGIQFGLMQYLGRMSGDNPMLMMVLTGLMIPLIQQGPMLMHWIMKELGQYLKYVPKNSARRVIEFTEGSNMEVRPDQGSLVREETSTERNNILQKAIRLYISKDKDKLSITDAEVYLLAAATGDGDDERSTPAFMYGRQHTRVKNFGDVDAGLKKLMGYSVTKGPREGKWLEVDHARHISFKFYCSKSVMADPDEYDDGGGKGKGRKGGGGGGHGSQSKRTTTFELMCEGKNAENVLDSYVEEALEYYKSLRSAAVDRSRYFFMPDYAPSTGHDDDHMPYGKGGGRGAGCAYKKYVLSEHKTFNSLFFPEKAQVIEMLDDFLQGRGKFAIEGFPNKLGLLLHGPPGTGKTSLIKSIASYTKRHIVEVPITKVKTNKMLFDSMFDLVFKCPGEDEALRMKFSDIVFVMEDVDAASNIVYSRTQQKRKKKKAPGKGKGKGALGKDFPPILEMLGKGPPLKGREDEGGKEKGKCSLDMVGKGSKHKGANYGDSMEEVLKQVTEKGVQVDSDVAVAADGTSGAAAVGMSVGPPDATLQALPGALAAPPLPPASCLPLVRSSSLPDYRTLASAALLERSSMRKLVRTITVGSSAAVEKDETPAAAKKHIMERAEDNEEEEDEEEEEEKEEEEDDEEEDEAIFGWTPWGKGGKKGMSTTKKKSKFTLDPDALNLSGLLNVLDGVVDSPGRILVMTTNHPEKLDAALIRPGRINFAIELGFMKAEQLCHLIQHLIREEITEEQRCAAREIASQGTITPAKVEQSCAEVNTIDGLLEKLRLIENATDGSSAMLAGTARP